MFHLSITLSIVGCGSALLDTKGGTQLPHQGRCEIHTPITQQLRGHPKNCYEALIEHFCDSFGSLFLCHHHKGIPHEMVCHHEDGWLVQFNHGLYTAVIQVHQLQQGIHPDWSKGSPRHLSLNAWQHGHPLTIMQQSSAIIGHQNLS